MTADVVVVVGAGPAGSVAALLLARAGLKVHLLDRATFPRTKLCGDTLNPGSLAILDRLGLSEVVTTGALRTSGMTVTGPRGTSVSADYPDGMTGVSLRRDVLDTILVEQAAAAGVRVETGVTVLSPLEADGRVRGVRIARGRGDSRLSARAVIAADGRASRLAFALRLSRFASSPRRWAYGAYFEGVDGLTTRGEMHVRAGGYIGVAPLPGQLANICVVRAHRRGDAGARPSPAVVDDVVRTDPLLRDRFRRAERVSPVTVLGPLAVDSCAAGCPGLVLAGDAAGFVDPMTGDGMRFALRGAELAAWAVMRELGEGAAAHDLLARARAREFTGKWRLNRALRRLVGSPRAVDAAALLTRGWSAPVQHLIAIAGDVPLARRDRGAARSSRFPVPCS